MKISYALLFAVLLMTQAPVSFSASDDAAKKMLEKVAAAIEHNAPVVLKKIKKSDSTFKSGELYAFVYDTSLNMVAHPDVRLVGQNLKGKADACGCNFRDEILNRVNHTKNETGCKISSDKNWVRYVYKNPTNGKLENKRAIFKAVQGSDAIKYIVVTGVYDGEAKSCIE